MRQLETADLFPMMRIIKKMELKKELAKMANEAKKEGMTAENFGLEVMALFVENIGKAENEVYAFLSGIAGKTPEEIKHQPLGDTLSMLGEMLEQPGISDFFKTAVKSTTP